MRNLLLVVFGVAGLQVSGLPALAQMAQDATEFTGAIAASCSISNLEENYQLDWRLSGLRKSVAFTISSNQAVSASYSYEKVSAPEGASPSEIFTLYQDSTQLVSLRNSPNTPSAAQSINLSSQNSASMRLSVVLYKGSIYRSIPPGEYHYRATISCLQ